MPLIRFENVSLDFGDVPLLKNVSFLIEPKERLFLIGRNGTGKSCLFKLILGALFPDQGQIFKSPGLRIAQVSQDLPQKSESTLYEFVAEGLKDVGALLKQYHQLTHCDPGAQTAQWLKELEIVQKQLDALGGWQHQQHIEAILSRLSLTGSQPMKHLSGGWQRRASLAQALVSQPDLLLLDEPTNHLDVEAIEWLEEYLESYGGALVCITHDRSFLTKLSKKIIELDRGHLTSFNQGFNRYLEEKALLLEVEQKQAQLFDKTLAKEEAWIRQGIQARRTRNEGRVSALKKLRQQKAARLPQPGKPQFKVNETAHSGDLILDVQNVDYQLQTRWLVKDFSTRIYKGDKIALVGPNGVGKSTLLKLLLGELEPQAGCIKQGTHLQIGYFDQLRSSIDPNLSAAENVAGGREMIEVQGTRKHIISYLSDFLFTPQRASVPVSRLSGGECNRLLFAKLFSLPKNLFVLDEPTNDLDIESLELLEDLLIDYPGTLILVSHDRTFIESIATSLFYFRGDGRIEEYVGGFSQIPPSVRKPAPTPVKLNVAPPKKAASTPTLSPSKIKRELEILLKKIEGLEAEQAPLQAEIASAHFYKNEKPYITSVLQRLEAVEKALEDCYKRWEILEPPS